MTLMSTGSFSTIDTLNIGQMTPDVFKLVDYDTVLVWVDTPLNDAVMLGDELASYVDGGGRVVTAAFAAKEIKGRFLTGGYLLVSHMSGTCDVGALGKIIDPNSPLVIGVQKLTAGSGCRSIGGPINGGVAVAQWGDGAPLIVTGKVNGRTRVDLNMIPVGDPDFMTSWVGDGAAILRNALVY